MSHVPFVLRGTGPGQAIEFVATPEISASSFDIAASLAGHRVEATSVTLFEGSFPRDLARFEKERVGTALLTGTYDFEFALGPFGGSGAALVRVSLTDLLPLPGGTHGRCRLDGAFVVPGEHVPAAMRGLERLFGPDRLRLART